MHTTLAALVASFTDDDVVDIVQGFIGLHEAFESFDGVCNRATYTEFRRLMLARFASL
jgi:hypothetical protein